MDSDLAGVRTRDPLIKSQMLYQLSYQVKSSERRDLFLPHLICTSKLIKFHFLYK